MDNGPERLIDVIESDVELKTLTLSDCISKLV